MSVCACLCRCQKVAPAGPSRHTRVLVVDARLDGHVKGQAVGRHAGMKCERKKWDGESSGARRAECVDVIYVYMGSISI
jgi:hypothetical protein